MALRKLTNAAYLATNWQDEVESKNDLKKGLCVVDLDPTAKQIKAGSVIEANGIIYKSDTATSPSNSPTTNLEYFIYFRDIASVLDFYYSTEAPFFNSTKNGWYGSVNTTWRAVAKVTLRTTWTETLVLDSFNRKEPIYGNMYISSLALAGTVGTPVKVGFTESYSKNMYWDQAGSLVLPKTGYYEVTFSCDAAGAAVDQYLYLNVGGSTIYTSISNMNATAKRIHAFKYIFLGIEGQTVSLYQNSGGSSITNANMIFTCNLIKSSDFAQIYSTATTSTATVNTKLNISTTSSVLSGFTIDGSGGLTALTDGKYMISFSADVTGISTKSYENIYVNSTPINAAMVQDNSATTYRSIYQNVVATVSAGQTISVYQYNGGAGTMTYSNLAFTVVKLDDIKTESATYAYTYVTGVSGATGTSGSPYKILTVLQNPSAEVVSTGAGDIYCLKSGSYRVTGQLSGTLNAENFTLMIRVDGVESYVKSVLTMSNTVSRSIGVLGYLNLKANQVINLCMYTPTGATVSFNTAALTLERLSN